MMNTKSPSILGGVVRMTDIIAHHGLSQPFFTLHLMVYSKGSLVQWHCFFLLQVSRIHEKTTKKHQLLFLLRVVSFSKGTRCFAFSVVFDSFLFFWGDFLWNLPGGKRSS